MTTLEKIFIFNIYIIIFDFFLDLFNKQKIKFFNFFKHSLVAWFFF